jgi:predicted RNA methylase
MTRTLTPHSRNLVQKLWNYCNLLRDDGLSYGDYVEQLTYLLFLKMAHERTEPPRSEPSRLPEGLDWPSLVSRSGPELEDHYNELLRRLGAEPRLLGLIFRKAQNRIQDPAKLRRLVVDLIDSETWTGVDADVKGDAYEGLLERNAADTKSGAGQYFTPRALIRAMVDAMRPRPDQTIADPACGTGGFLLAAHEFITHHYRHELDPDQKRFLRDEALRGVEIVDNTARLCAMNLHLHGIGGADVSATPPIEVRDALLREHHPKVDMVLANPPFGKKSSITVVGEDGRASSDAEAIAREDFWATTSNKQLNFVQHIRSMLAIGGQAAMVVPDNALRGRRRRDDPAAAPARVRRPHPAAAADRDLLRPGREGQRPLLRAQGRFGDAVDARAVGLRLPHQPALYAQDPRAQASRPRRVRGRVSPRRAPPTRGIGELQALDVRGARRAAGIQPRRRGERPRRVTERSRVAAGARGDRTGDRGGRHGGDRGVRGGGDGAGSAQRG